MALGTRREEAISLRRSEHHSFAMVFERDDRWQRRTTS